MKRDWKGAEIKTGTACRQPSMTRQSEAEGADINVIMKRYEKTGLLPQVTQEALFLDVSEMPDYRTALGLVAEVDRVFRELPAEKRALFRNDTAEFMDFASDPANRGRMVELGLLPAPEVPPVVAEAAPEAPAGA